MKIVFFSIMDCKRNAVSAYIYLQNPVEQQYRIGFLYWRHLPPEIYKVISGQSLEISRKISGPLTDLLLLFPSHAILHRVKEGLIRCGWTSLNQHFVTSERYYEERPPQRNIISFRGLELWGCWRTENPRPGKRKEHSLRSFLSDVFSTA